MFLKRGGNKVKEDRKIGQYIKEQRMLNGFSMSELSKRSGVSQPYLSQIEKGDRMPSPTILKKLATALNLSFTDLMVIAEYLKDGRITPDEQLNKKQKEAMIEESKEILKKVKNFTNSLKNKNSDSYPVEIDEEKDYYTLEFKVPSYGIKIAIDFGGESSISKYPISEEKARINFFEIKNLLNLSDQVNYQGTFLTPQQKELILKKIEEIVQEKE